MGMMQIGNVMSNPPERMLEKRKQILAMIMTNVTTRAIASPTVSCRWGGAARIDGQKLECTVRSAGHSESRVCRASSGIVVFRSP